MINEKLTAYAEVYEFIMGFVGSGRGGLHQLIIDDSTSFVYALNDEEVDVDLFSDRIEILDGIINICFNCRGEWKSLDGCQYDRLELCGLGLRRAKEIITEWIVDIDKRRAELHEILSRGVSCRENQDGKALYIPNRRAWLRLSDEQLFAMQALKDRERATRWFA